MAMGNTLSKSNLEVLIDATRIASRIRELGEQISNDYRGRTPHLVGVLMGAWVFMADLIRNLSIEVTVDFLGIQSYLAGTTSSGEVKITKILIGASRAATFWLSRIYSTRGELISTCRGFLPPISRTA